MLRGRRIKRCSVELFDTKWLGGKTPHRVGAARLVEAEENMGKVNESEEKVAIKAHANGDEVPDGNTEKAGALDK